MLKFGYSVLPQLSKEEEEEIYKNWNRENKAKLIESNIRLALHIANRYEGLLDDDDLVSISLFGLVKAGNNYVQSVVASLRLLPAAVLRMKSIWL